MRTYETTVDKNETVPFSSTTAYIHYLISREFKDQGKQSGRLHREKDECSVAIFFGNITATWRRRNKIHRSPILLNWRNSKRIMARPSLLPKGGPAAVMGITSLVAIGAIFYSHDSQVRDRDSMKAGVERDKERIRQKRRQRKEQELQETKTT